MDLNLFRKVEPHRGLFAVEKVTLVYDLLTSILILCLFRIMSHPGQMLLDRTMIAGVTFLLMYLYRLLPCRFTIFIRIAVQMSLLSYWYPDTYELNRFFPNLDHVFAGAEQWVFGTQPALWFSQVFSSPMVSEAFNMGYFSYYPMILLVTLFYFFYRFQNFEKASFILVASFFIYYLIYVFVPVAGPQFYFPAIGMDNVKQGVFLHLGDYFNYHQELLPGGGYEGGFFHNLVEESQQVGERPTAAFPSSHVGISTILMILSWKGSKRLFALLTPFYVLLCGATVYIQAHYVIDALAGFVSAFLIYWLVSSVVYRWFTQNKWGIIMLKNTNT